MATVRINNLLTVAQVRVNVLFMTKKKLPKYEYMVLPSIGRGEVLEIHPETKGLSEEEFMKWKLDNQLKLFNELGEEGWLICGTAHWVLILAREKH